MSTGEILSLIIVEDESIMLEELKTTIDWEDLEIEVVATACNGVEGERKIKELLPDIVITDIRLPLQDGLQMVENCPMLYQNVLVLSGYTDFSYTRRAIQLGVFDYIEKPVDDEELVKVIRKLAEGIRAEHKAEVSLSEKADGFIPLLDKVGNYQVNAVIEFIKTHYKEMISLSDAASSVKLTEGHLSTLFKEVTGIGYIQYLNAYRINRSIELLKDEKELNIAEISQRSGFPSPGYYSKLFRRYTGKTPREYRDGLY